MYFVQSIHDNFRQFEYIWNKVQGKENKLVVNDEINGKTDNFNSGLCQLFVVDGNIYIGKTL
jgi:hypothetical protein